MLATRFWHWRCCWEITSGRISTKVQLGSYVSGVNSILESDPQTSAVFDTKCNARIQMWKALRLYEKRNTASRSLMKQKIICSYWSRVGAYIQMSNQARSFLFHTKNLHYDSHVAICMEIIGADVWHSQLSTTNYILCLDDQCEVMRRL